MGSHFDPECDLFVPSERNMVLTSDACLLAMVGVLAAATAKLGVAAMVGLYFVPYWVFVMWLDTVTYLQHHGSSDPQEKLPWYRCGSCRPPPPGGASRSMGPHCGRAWGNPHACMAQGPGGRRLLCRLQRRPCHPTPTPCSPSHRLPPRPPFAPRGEEWSYLRGGLTCLDRDYGIFHWLTHNIGTHVVHHLFPQVTRLVEGVRCGAGGGC